MPTKAVRRSKSTLISLSVRPVRTPLSTSDRGPPSDPSWPNFAIFSKSPSSDATAPMPQLPSHSKARRIQTSAERERLPAQPAGGLFPLFRQIPRTHSISTVQGSPPLLAEDLSRRRDMPPTSSTPSSSRGLTSEFATPDLSAPSSAINCSNSLVHLGGLSALLPSSPSVPLVSEGVISIPQLVEYLRK